MVCTAESVTVMFFLNTFKYIVVSGGLEGHRNHGITQRPTLVVNKPMVISQGSRDGFTLQTSLAMQ